MKVNQEQNEVIRSGDFEENAFKIKASAQAFQILSSGLYSNKIQAIIRELACNAADAHAAAGTTDTPFVVQLPHSLNDQFRIRDFGTGLCDEDVLELYTTYFGSNKQDSDDFTGCFGLGSKSPFAYTDSFTVESFFHGTKSTFTAFIAEGGFPNIAKVSSEATEEANGLAVSFHVQDYDAWKFEAEAGYVFSFFQVPYKVVGGTSTFCLRYPFGQYEPILSGKNWALYEKGIPTDFVVMGNVAYLVPPAYSLPKLNRYTQSAIAWLPVGSLDVTPSRESLSMTQRTTDTLKELVSSIEESLIEEVEKEIAKQPSLHKARLKYLTLCRNTLGMFPPIYWQGKQITERVKVSANLLIFKYETHRSRNGNYTGTTRYVCAGDNIQPTLDNIEVSSNIALHELVQKRTYLVHLTTSDISLAAVKRWCRGNYTSRVVIYGPEDEVKHFIEEELDEYYSSFTHVENLPNIQDYINPPRSKSANVKAVKFVRPHTGDRTDLYWREEDDFDFSAGGYYVPISRWKVEKSSFGIIGPKDLGEIISLVQVLDGSEVPVYGVKKRFLNKFEKSSKWVDFIDYAEELVKKNATTYKAPYLYFREETLPLVNTFAKYITTNNEEIKGVIDYHKEMVKVKEKGKAWASLKKAFSGRFVDTNVSLQYTQQDIRKKLLAQYPMLLFVDYTVRLYGRIQEQQKEIQEYVDLVDNS